MFIACLFGTQALSAHAFGVRYQLDVPLYYYVLGAGLTVGLSFVIAALFLKKSATPSAPIRLKLLDLDGAYGWVVSGARWLCGLVGVAVFFIILTAGFAGEQSPTRNIAPVFVWSIWWVGMVYVQALVGDVWRLVNPWRLVFDAVVATLKLGPFTGRLTYPVVLSRWPAVAFFWLFAWLEQVAPFAEVPSSLALLILVYSAIVWVGMFLFGRDVWLDRAEIFSILFGFLARIAPTKIEDGKLWLRPLGVGLASATPLSRASTVLLLLLLATVTFDGFRDTQVWADLIEWALTRSWLFAPLFWVQQQNIDLRLFFESVGLLVVPLFFFVSYGVIAKLSALLSDGSYNTRSFSGQFVMALLPISLAYHIAHYLAFLLLAGQLAIPLASDPFHVGWDLFGTLGYRMDVGIIGIGTVWWVSMAAVVIGHMYAVYTAHVMAVASAKSHGRALFSQLPLIVLMVCYTMASLWILAQPIVQSD
ncbi:MAG: hypothetical protein COB37_02080 [Kordiimonadales bacterium]|nr:MAG: hypothetical protein COB37_02080 [Kordiimonadales bacterium]